MGDTKESREQQAREEERRRLARVIEAELEYHQELTESDAEE